MIWPADTSAAAEDAAHPETSSLSANALSALLLPPSSANALASTVNALSRVTGDSGLSFPFAPLNVPIFTAFAISSLYHAVRATSVNSSSEAVSFAPKARFTIVASSAAVRAPEAFMFPSDPVSRPLSTAFMRCSADQSDGISLKSDAFTVPANTFIGRSIAPASMSEIILFLIIFHRSFLLHLVRLH